MTPYPYTKKFFTFAGSPSRIELFTQPLGLLRKMIIIVMVLQINMMGPADCKTPPYPFRWQRYSCTLLIAFFTIPNHLPTAVHQLHLHS